MRATPYQFIRFQRRIGLARTHLLATTILILVLLASVAKGAGEVLIVKSSDADPYQQAEAAVRDELTRRHYSIHASSLKDITPSVAVATKHSTAVLAVGTPAAKFLHAQLPANVPLVYCMVSNPKESGLLAGRQSLGVTTDVALPEQMKVIAEALPQARVIGLLYRGDDAEGKRLAQDMQHAAPAGWRVEAVAANEFSSVAAAIAALTQKKLDIIWTTADPKLYDTAAVRSLLLSALRSKIPVWGFSPAFVRAGGLVGVGVEPKAQGKQAAQLLVNLLEQPSSVAERVQPAREYQIAVNFIVAKQLGVQVPEEFARKAAFVFRGEN